MLGKLDFVDRKRFKKGVDMNVRTSLVTIGIKKGQKANPSMIELAVDDAGYDAVEWYTLKKGKLQIYPFLKLKPFLKPKP